MHQLHCCSPLSCHVTSRGVTQSRTLFTITITTFLNVVTCTVPAAGGRGAAEKDVYPMSSGKKVPDNCGKTPADPGRYPAVGDQVAIVWRISVIRPVSIMIRWGHWTLHCTGHQPHSYTPLTDQLRVRYTSNRDPVKVWGLLQCQCRMAAVFLRWPGWVYRHQIAGTPHSAL